jgi:hypothetical protein
MISRPSCLDVFDGGDGDGDGDDEGIASQI